MLVYLGKLTGKHRDNFSIPKLPSIVILQKIKEHEELIRGKELVRQLVRNLNVQLNIPELS